MTTYRQIDLYVYERITPLLFTAAGVNAVYALYSYYFYHITKQEA